MYTNDGARAELNRMVQLQKNKEMTRARDELSKLEYELCEKIKAGKAEEIRSSELEQVLQHRFANLILGKV